MVISRVFDLLAITLCLVACMCANAEVTKENTESVVKETQEIAKKVLQQAEFFHNQSDTLPRLVEGSISEAESIAIAAEQMEKKHSENKSLSEEISKALDELRKGCNTALEKAKTAVTITHTIVTNATQLHNKAQSINVASGDAEKEIAKIQEKAEDIKAKAKELETKISDDVSKALSAGMVAHISLSEQMNSIELRMYKDNSLAAGATISSMVTEAETDISTMETTRDEMNATVKEIHKLVTQSLDTLETHINSLYSTAEDDLQWVTNAIENAKKLQEEMVTQRTLATDALEKIKAAEEENQLKTNANIVTTAISALAKKAEDIKHILETAKIYASNAISRKESADQSIKTGNVVAATIQNVKPKPSRTENPNHSMEDSKESSSRNGEEQQKEMQKISENEVRPIMDQVNQPLKNKIESTVNGGTELKRHLSSHNGELGDSAVSVSVSLLIALIACAAMH